MNQLLVWNLGEIKETKKFDSNLILDTFLDPDLTYENLIDLIQKMETKRQLNMRSFGRGSTEIMLKDVDNKCLNELAKSHSLDTEYGEVLRTATYDLLKEATISETNCRKIVLIPQDFENSKKEWLHLEYHLFDLQFFHFQLQVRSLHITRHSGLKMVDLKPELRDALGHLVKNFH